MASGVTFRDPFLEAAIREVLSRPDGELDEASLLTLTQLSARGRGIVHLEGLERLTHLQVLDLAMNLVYDLAPLSALSELERLDLEDNRVSDISPLRPLVRLRFLLLATNLVEDITPLVDLPDLASVDLMGNPLSPPSAAPVIWVLVRRGVRVASGVPLAESGSGSATVQWEALGPSLKARTVRVSSVAVAPDDPLHVYAATYGDGVWASRDAGGTWETTPLAGYVCAVSTDARDPALVYASTAPVGPGVWRSTDGGNSWEVVRAPPQVSLLAADPIVPGRVYGARQYYANWVCCQQPTQLGVAVHVSHDCGDTWQATGEWIQRYTGGLAAPFGWSHPADTAHIWVGACGAGGGRSSLEAVFSSRDGGESWDAVELPVTLAAVAPDPAVSDALYGVYAGNLYHSSDQGETWVQVASTGRTPLNRIHVAPGPSRHLWLWTSTGSELWGSADAGRTWYRGSMGNVSPGVGPVWARSDPRYAYAGAIRGIARTMNGGASWQSVPLSVTAPGVRWVAAGADGAVYAVVTPGNGLLVRRTPWDSWQALPSPTVSGAPALLSVLWADARSSGLLFGHARGTGWLRSSDGGSSWQPMRLSGADTVSAARVRPAASREGEGVVYAVDPTARALYRTAATGLSWERVAEDVALFAVHPLAGGVLVASTPATGLLRKTADGGYTWSDLGGCPTGEGLLDLAIHPLRADPVVAACTGGLYALSLGGTEPRLLLRAALEWAEARVYFDPADNTDLGILAGGSLWRSGDAGRTWGLLSGASGSPAGALNDLVVDPAKGGALYVGTAAGVYRVRGRAPATWVGDEVMSRGPREPLLASPYPNPFNGRAVIRYWLPRSASVEMAVHDVLGQRVATLVDAIRPAGDHAVAWDGRDGQGRPVGSGVYVCRLVAGGDRAVGRLVLAR
ncbi:MAG: leucine-rich repeat domain-containing protein [Candidatus Latescibacterota bacterium]